MLNRRNCAGLAMAFALAALNGCERSEMYVYPPTIAIASQPSDQTALAGQNATFSVTVIGTNPIAYQWQRLNESVWVDVMGATAHNHTVNSVSLADNGAQFRCTVTNAAGSLVSNAATLTVTELTLAISQHPSNQTAMVGQSATFSVTATGTNPISYQWQRLNESVWVDVMGATTNSHTVASVSLDDNGAQFRCTVTNAAGSMVSNAATLSVTEPSLTVSMHPSDHIAFPGETATFSVEATGPGAITYQWQRNNGSAWENIGAASSASYTTGSVSLNDNGALFRCVVTNSDGSVASNAATLIAIPATWSPSAALATRFAQTPNTTLDQEIKALITDYTARINALNQNSQLVRQNLPRLREQLHILYREYNLSKTRQPASHFTPAECLDWLKRHMTFLLDDGLEQGKNPYSGVQGWQPRAYWLDDTNVMGRYDLIVPQGYDPSKSWPIMICFQGSPTTAQMRTVPYFLVRSVQKGNPSNFVALEQKVRNILMGVASEFNIDPFRFYGIGFSFGGHTAQRLTWRFTHWFAAIAPVGSDLRGGDAPRVKHIVTPTKLLYGNNDSFKSDGLNIYNWMVEAGRCPDVRWEEFSGGHDAKVPFEEDITMLTDFFDIHTLVPYPKTVHHLVEHKRYARAFWTEAILVSDITTAAPFTITIGDGNAIEIVEAHADIAGFNFYLNDQLVDMNSPITITYGGAVVFSGMPSAEISVSIREGQSYWFLKRKPLWEHLVDIRKTARP